MLCALLAATAPAQQALPAAPGATPQLEHKLVLAFLSDQRALLATTHKEHVVTAKDNHRDGRTLQVWYVKGRAVSETVALDDRALSAEEVRAEHARACARAAALAARTPPPLGELEFGGHRYPFARLARDYLYLHPRILVWNGRPTWAYNAVPNPGVRARSREEKLLLHSHGEVYVDAADLHVVRMTIHNSQPVTYGLGVLATIREADFLLQLQRLAPGVWLPSAAGFHLRATVLLFDQLSRAKEQRFYQYSVAHAAGLGCGE
ncbi:MAG: hypothetical protein ACRD1C_05945 [Terriglobales bacterium]